MKPPIYDPGWPDDVKALYRHDMQEMWDSSIAPHVRLMYQEDLRHYRRVATEAGRPLRVLDVGCAQGTLALLLAEDGHAVVGMDIRPQFLDYAKSRYEKGDVTFLAANAMECDMTAQFDLIFANQILEHLVYPVAFLRHLAPWLTPGGRLIITTPNGHYLPCSHPTYSELGDLTQYEDRQFSADGDGHFFAYTSAELKDVFVAAGLTRIRINCFASPWVTGHMKLRHLQPVIPVALLRGFDWLTLSLPLIRRRLGYQLWAEGIKA